MIKLNLNEKIILKVVPDKKLRLKQNEWLKIPFSILWFIGFYLIATAWTRSGSMDNLMFRFVAFAMFFGGLYVLFGRFILKYIEIRNSIYYITDSRLVIYNNFWKRTKSINYDEFDQITLKKYNKQIGYIIFGEPESLIGWRGMVYTEDKYLFENIRYPEQIHRTIKEAMEKYRCI